MLDNSKLHIPIKRCSHMYLQDSHLKCIGMIKLEIKVYES